MIKQDGYLKKQRTASQIFLSFSIPCKPRCVWAIREQPRRWRILDHSPLTLWRLSDVFSFRKYDSTKLSMYWMKQDFVSATIIKIRFIHIKIKNIATNLNSIILAMSKQDKSKLNRMTQKNWRFFVFSTPNYPASKLLHRICYACRIWKISKREMALAFWGTLDAKQQEKSKCEIRFSKLLIPWSLFIAICP